MKKLVALVLALMLCIGVIGATAELEMVNGTYEIMMGTATTGGFTYIWGAAAAQIINKYVPNVNVTAQITTGGNENLVSMFAGDMPMGIAGSNMVQKFYDGDPGAGIPEVKNLRTLWVSKSTVFSAIVHTDAPYQTLEDLKGKKVSIGNKGGSAYEAIYSFLEALGMGGDYFNLQYLTMTESADAMKTHNIDAFFTCTSDPHTAMTEVFNMPGGARFLDWPQSVIDTLLEKIPYLSPAVRPAGTYKNQAKDLISVGSPYALLVTEDFPEELAYEIAKALNEHYDEWVNIAANCEGSTAQAVVNGYYAPLHPGCERYLKEIGVITE